MTICMSRLLNIVLCFFLFVPIADAAKDAMEFPTGLPISVIGAGSGTPSSGNCAQFDSNGDLVDAGAPCGGAGASPGGANTQVQFNDSGSFGGNAGFIFNKTSGNVGIGTTVPQGKLVVMNGNVGIGTIAPPALLSLGQTLGNRVFFLSDGRIQAGAYDFNDENPFHFQYTMSDNPYSSNRYFLRSTATVSRSGVTDSYGYGAVLGKIIARNNSTYALIEGVYGYSSVDDSANVTTSTGGRLIAYHDGTGAVTNQYGTIADTGVRDTGNVANNVGVIVTTPTISSSGTITGHNYGIKIEDQDVGTGQKYAVYTGGTSKSYFGGNVGIGTLNPTAKLNVNGTATISGNITTNITGSTQCVQADSSGVLSGTGSACGAGGGTNYWSLGPGNIGINTTNNVGIGTVSPIRTFEVSSNSQNEVAAIRNQWGSYIGIGGTSSITPYIQGYLSNGAPDDINLQQTSMNVGIGSAVPRAKLDVSGNVILGTSDANAHLMFKRAGYNYVQAPASGSIAFMTNGATPSDVGSNLVLNSDGRSWFRAGNVGVGTSNPGSTLEVVGNNSTYVNLRVHATVPQSSFSGAGILGYQNNGAAMTSGSRLGFYSLGGARDSSGNLSNSIVINGFANQNWNSTSAGSYMTVEVTPDGTTTRSEAMRIQANGNVGIATTKAAAELHVLQTAAGDAFRVDDVASDTTPFVIDQNGNVGIGSTSPAAALDVNGAIRSSSGTAGQAACWKADKTLGQCTSAVGAGGACTCS